MRYLAKWRRLYGIPNTVPTLVMETLSVHGESVTKEGKYLIRLGDLTSTKSRSFARTE